MYLIQNLNSPVNNTSSPPQTDSGEQHWLKRAVNQNHNICDQLYLFKRKIMHSIIKNTTASVVKIWHKKNFNRGEFGHL